MSADNCVAILKTTDKFKQSKPGHLENVGYITAYRIAHLQAIDNFDYYKHNQIHNLGWWMDECFGKSEVIYDEDKAILTAHKMAKNIDYLEYGIVTLDASKYNFPGY